MLAVVAVSSDSQTLACTGRAIRSLILRMIAVLFALYFFLVGLDLMGRAMVVLGGKGAAELFASAGNPLNGLMIGIMATALVQSSSTSTSIVVGLVGAGQMTVRAAIPVIMGANVGTSITNTIVSIVHAASPTELEHAFAGATVHEMFNLLTVLILLPTEILVGFIRGDGGPLYLVSKAVTEAAMGTGALDVTFSSPTKWIVGPLTDCLLDANKDVVKAYFCVSTSMQSAWKKLDLDGFAALTQCSHVLSFPHGCAQSTDCYLEAGKFYAISIENARTLDSGVFARVGDVVGGACGLVLSFVVITGSLLCLVKVLNALLTGWATKMMRRASKTNDYLAVVLGITVTVVVQSSSVTTSTLIPLCAMQVLSVQKMLPITIGVVATALLVMVLAVFVVWWWMGGRYVVVSREIRRERAEQRARELELARESPKEKTLIRSRSNLSTSTQDAQLLVVVESSKEPSATQAVGALQEAAEFDEETIEADEELTAVETFDAVCFSMLWAPLCWYVQQAARDSLRVEESAVGMLSDLYKLDIGGTVQAEALRDLRATPSQIITSHWRLLPFAFQKTKHFHGRFGVVVGDRAGWYVCMLLAASVKEKTHSVHFFTQYVVPSTGEDADLATLHAANPNRADWVFFPPGTLGDAGFDLSQGRFDLAADAERLRLAARGLSTNGRVVAVIQAGDGCLVLNRGGRATRVYSQAMLEHLLEQWEVEDFVEYPEQARVSFGPCRSRWVVIVLRHRWDRHPASLLSVKRLDVMPKLLYAIHRRQLGVEAKDRNVGQGAWAEELYFRSGIAMGALSEHCRFDNTMGAEPCQRKFGKEAFRHGFEFLMNSVEYLGFTRAISGLRTDINNELLNGAHRLAVALAAGLPA
ncbi:SLC34A1, partial [Symbiodinium sp. KB8]